MLGGAFGFGLSQNVISSYRFLAQNYEPGDEIFIVGFSRGAYTARSLAGMIGRVGLLTERARRGEAARRRTAVAAQTAGRGGFRGERRGVLA